MDRLCDHANFDKDKHDHLWTCNIQH